MADVSKIKIDQQTYDLKDQTARNALVNATTESAGLMSAEDKSKLDGIAPGATANIGTITGINMNGASKGTSGVVNLGTVITAHQDISGKADKSSTVSNVSYDSTNNKITKTINGTTSDVVTAATLKTAMSLGNVENKSSATIRSEITSSDVTTGLGFTPMNASIKGANNGVAELDSAGKVPASQLPSYVDDVLEYDKQSSFPATGETGKIYVAKDTNKTYRWSGTAYVEISPSLALGETSSTAYRGDRGKTAYDHASAKGSAFEAGLYKITTNSEGHVTAATAVAKSDITGLGIPGSDTNTHRPIQVNGTQILGDNTTALNLKAGSNVSVTNSSGTVTIAATDTTYSDATTSASGLMSAADKTKLDGVAEGATANVGTITGIKMNGSSKGTSGVVDLGTVITAHQDISGKVSGPASATNNAVAIFDGTGGKTIKNSGYTIGKSVPSDAKFTDTTYSAATQSAAGLMSAADKTKLDGVATGANKITKVSELTNDSGFLTAHQDISGKLNGKMVSLGSGYTWANLIAEAMNDKTIFFTNWSDETNFPARFGSGIILYAADYNSHSIIYSVNGKLYSRYVYPNYDTGWKELLTQHQDISGKADVSSVSTPDWHPGNGESLLTYVWSLISVKFPPITFTKYGGGTITDGPIANMGNEFTCIIYGSKARYTVLLHSYGSSNNSKIYTRQIFSGDWLTSWNQLVVSPVGGLSWLTYSGTTSGNGNLKVSDALGTRPVLYAYCSNGSVIARPYIGSGDNLYLHFTDDSASMGVVANTNVSGAVCYLP